MSTCTVTISGSSVTLQEGTLQITSRVDDKDKATFTVIDSSGTAAYTKGQPVRITDSQLGLLFSGFINKPTCTNLFPSATNMWSVDCVNKFVVAAKKATKPPSTTTGRKHHRGGKHKNQHSGTIVANQIKEYVEPEGVTGNFGLDWTELQSDWQSGTLSGVAATTNTSTGNVGAGDLELAPVGPLQVQIGAGSSFGTANGLMLTGYASSGYTTAYTYQQIWSGSQVINSVGGGSDNFTFDVWIASTSPQIMAGCDFICSDGTTLSSTNQNDNSQGLSCSPKTDLSGLANDQWLTRNIFLPSSLNGKTLTGVFVVLGGTSAGTYTAYFRRIRYGISIGGGSVNIFGDASTLQMNAQGPTIGYTNILLSPVQVSNKSTTILHSVMLGSPVIVQSSQISWTQTVPSGASLIRETSIDNKASWQVATNGNAVPNLLPGMVASGLVIWYRDKYTKGIDPTALLSAGGATFTIANAYQSSKTDSATTYTTSTDFNGGTLTNLITAGSNGITLNGVQRNWDTGFFGNQTLYGSIGQIVLNKQFQLSADTSTEGRSRLDFANQWQNFTAEVDFVFSAANVQCGFVWRTTGWQNANDTYAYTATVSSSQVQFGRGTNTSSGGGAFTNIQTISLSLSVNSSHRLKIVVNGNNHQIFVDNVLLINQNDSTYPSAGYIGLRILNSGSGIQTGTFDNFGVTASLTGTWQSPSINIASPSTYGGSLVQWDTDSLPDNTTSISVQTSIDGGSTFQNVANGGTVSGLTSGQSLVGKTLILKVTLAANNAPVVPTMNGITAWILGFYSSTGSRSNAPMVWDSVTRLPVVSGWGNASNGEAYTQTGTATTATTGSEATITNTSGDCHMVPAAPTNTDEDGSVRFQLSAATISAGIELRYVDTNNFFRCSTSTTTITLLQKASGTSNTLATASVSLSTGIFYWMRFQVIGSGPVTLQARVWANGTTEPTTWNITATI